MSDTETDGPEFPQGDNEEFTRNDLGELVIGEDTRIGYLDFDAGTTIRELYEEIFGIASRETQEEIDLARDRILVITEAKKLYIDKTVSEGLDDTTTEEAESLIASLRRPRGLLVKPEDIDIGIIPRLNGLLIDAIAKESETALKAAEDKSEIKDYLDGDKKLMSQINLAKLEKGFETDIESPLSWSQENWQQVASMTPEEQEYFAGKKKQSNASKRVWARRANEMLHDAMLEQALQEAIGRWDDLNEIEEKAGVKMPTSNDLDRDTLEALHSAIKERQSVVAKRGWATQQANNRPLTQALQEAEDRLNYLTKIKVKMPTYNYQEWKIMEALAAQAEQANAMLNASMYEQARQKAIDNNEGADAVTVEEGNYTYTEWKAMEVLAEEAEQANAMLEEQARQEAISKGLDLDTITIDKYTWPEWVAIKALLVAQAREANAMLYAEMSKEARQREKDLGYNPNTILVKMPTYNYTEWKAMEVLAEEAEQANAMLEEQARQEAISKGLDLDTITIDKYTWPEWVAIKAIHSAIKERQSDAAKRGWATRMNSKLPDGEEIHLPTMERY